MKILGTDPGTNFTGWSTLDVTGGAGQPIVSRYLAKGEVASEVHILDMLIRSERPDVLAVEVLEGIAYPVKGAGIVGGLVASSRVAGRIEAIAWALKIRVVALPAVKWRGLVLGKPNASDQLIAEMIPRLIVGWPKVSNVHARDAAGCALGAAWHLNGK